MHDAWCGGHSNWDACWAAAANAAPAPPAAVQPAASAEPVEVPEAIRVMAQRIANDDFKHCTSDPIFTVQKRNIVGGFDLDFISEVGWFRDGDLVTGDAAKALEDEYEKTGVVPDEYTRTGIIEQWDHYATYVTMEAAQDFADRKGEHCRVYVDSGCRNHEWKALRGFLLKIAANQTLAARAAKGGEQ